MNIVAAECAVKRHHPEWSNVSLITWAGSEVIFADEDVGVQYVVYQMDYSLSAWVIRERCPDGTLL
jgi:hypothetical protein